MSSGNALACLVLLTARIGSAQSLVPRAYFITPTGSNAVTLSSSWNNGQITVDPSVPIEDGKGRFGTYVLSYYHSYGLLGRSSNIVLVVPYGSGNFEGVVAGFRAQTSPSGMADAQIRVSVNLRGGPAMPIREYVRWHEKSLIGASLTVVVPTGQNDPARVLNLGTNRWAFKPEVGFTRRWQRWVSEGYVGTWLFTSNPAFYPGNSTRTQRPMAALEGHLAYYLRHGLWTSFDGNFWTGGRSAINGKEKQDAQKESRIGATVSIPIVRHQSLKVSYSRGAFVRIGGHFQTISVSWQYSWVGKSL